MSKRGWYSREEVNRISQDWISMNCKNITNREKELLRIVWERKMVRRDHLEVIHPLYRNVGDRRTSVLNRSITKLFRKMCLDKAHEEAEFMKGNTPAVVAIDKAGAFLLGKKFRRRIKQNKRLINGETFVFRSLPTNYRHIHGVNELEVKTIELCQNKGFSLIRWDLEQENAQKLSFSEKFTIIPDIFTIIKADNKPFLAFIEYDTGSEDNRYKDKFPTLREKLEKYQQYMRSGVWKKQWWATKIKTGFPILLFVTEDERRIDYINKKGKSLGIRVVAMHTNEYTEKMGSLI